MTWDAGLARYYHGLAVHLCNALAISPNFSIHSQLLIILVRRLQCLAKAPHSMKHSLVHGQKFDGRSTF